MRHRLSLLLTLMLLLNHSFARSPKKIYIRKTFCSVDKHACNYALIYKNDSGVRLDFYDCKDRLKIRRNYAAGLRVKKDLLCGNQSMLHGEEVYYDTAGNIRERNYYHNGYLTGKTFTYHSNGQTASEGKYVDGHKSGVFRYYDTSGQLTGENTFKRGNRFDGIWKDHYPNGFVHVSYYRDMKLLRTAVLKSNGDTSSVYHFRWDGFDRMIATMDVYYDNRFAYKRPFAPNYRDSFFLDYKQDSMKKFKDTVNNRDITFIGGMNGLNTFLEDNLDYPSSAINDEEEGKVIVNMLFGKEGILLDVFSRSEVDAALVQEAIRVILETEGMWLFAMRDGKPVMLRARIPISFIIRGY